jgi:High potential iron-sulfur protein
MTSTRRVFVIAAAGAAGAAWLPAAQAQTKLDEKDAQAVSLGYVHDATKADRKKFPKFADGQNCANCALFQAKGSDPWGGCPLFGARQVAAKGWCSAWAKKG